MPEAQQVGVRHDDRNQGDDEGLLAQQDAAHPLPVSLSTLRRWGQEGTGPPGWDWSAGAVPTSPLERWLRGRTEVGTLTNR